MGREFTRWEVREKKLLEYYLGTSRYFNSKKMWVVTNLVVRYFFNIS